MNFILILFLTIHLSQGRIGLEMIALEKGRFVMGCLNQDQACEQDEKPRHEVELSAFYLSKYPISQAQWAEIMGDNPSFFQDCWTCPVENVTWYEVQTFIQDLNQRTGENFRLPTEAEWEYAARAGQESLYAGGSELENLAWYKENSQGKTQAMGQKQPNAWGFYDFSGSVFEWCSDWYDPNYYTYSPKTNPQGPEQGQYKVLRGGAWDYPASSCRLSYRFNGKPQDRGANGGFRLAKDEKK